MDADWFSGKDFTSDFTSAQIKIWTQAFAPIRQRELSILEIGSWEGRSAVFFLEFFPRSRIVCVDTFAGGIDHIDSPKLAPLISGTEGRFDSNTHSYGDRCEKVKMRSLPALDSLAQAGRRFDLVYIDGSHQRDDVLMDSLLAWGLVVDQGYIIWDDYLWGDELTPSQRPKQAIDLFLTMNDGHFELIHLGMQALVRKTPMTAPQESRIRVKVPRTFRNFAGFMAGHIQLSINAVMRLNGKNESSSQ